jgi:hypothetical protein
MQMTGEQRWIKEQLQRDYLAGMNLWQIGRKYKHQASQKEIRLWLGGLVRRVGVERVVSEEEVAQRKIEVQASWTPEQASRRWVGRLLQRSETIHSSASKLLPD